MYAEMFRPVAEGKLQGLCIRNLRTWVPAMDMEKHPVN